ncbi:hypothetical protein DK846_03385 [Methanospirillum lacunae]|uniref:Uncharacterized protein n=2 Tax=Methanospirillum lacunae TaxID=668570 RepID=A0A2V2N6T0_9EURY|nr:hypothetical protein DK846_03385 [Methanospirillum lacunae]
MPGSDPAHYPTRSACSILFEQGQTVEVRLIGKRGTASGYYDNFDRLSADAVSFDNRGEYSGIYVTLNPVNPDLLARRANRIETRLGKDEKSAGDKDILKRRWLAIDIDPVRPSGVSSSDAEHTSAIEKAARIAAYFTGLGWPAPVMADSGNGAHLLYRIDLPNDDVSRDLVRSVLETLDLLFSDACSTIDTSVFNAARIWKLYGTTSRKGDNIAARPHRKAQILSDITEPEIVSEAFLTALAGMFPQEAEPLPPAKGQESRSKSPLDLGLWLDHHSIGYRKRPYAHGELFVLDACPFSQDHTDGAYAIQFPNGAIFAGCHHDSCGGGRQRWPELRAMLDGGSSSGTGPGQAKKKRDQKPPATVISSGGKPVRIQVTGSPDDPGSSGDIETKATAILRTGDPLSCMLETFALDHIGDPVVAECLVMSLASRKVINARGLHVSVTGESGKGKSHAFETMMSQIPPEFRLEGRMSEKALFYIKGMQPGSVITLDDVSLSDQMQEILKGVTTSFRRPFIYRTVSKDRVGETCVIPERCVWWIAKVDGTGDDQVWNRMLTCWIDDSEEQDAAVITMTLNEAAGLRQEKYDVRVESLVCQEIWRQLEAAWVVIPFANRIRFSSTINRRNPDMILDLVRAHAILMQCQRVHVDTNGMNQILATEVDFNAATRLYTALNSTSGGQESKLTRRESFLVDAIRSHGTGEITIAELQHITDLSNSVIYKIIHGSSSHGHEYSGLLEKCPAISVCDRTLVVDESGTTAAYRRSKAYSWDERVYQNWRFEGGCWLDPDDSTHDDPASNDKKDGHTSEPDDPSCGIAERCSIVADDSAKNRDENSGVKSKNNNNYCTSGTLRGKSENTGEVVSDTTVPCSCACDPEISARSDHEQGTGADVSSDCESGPCGTRPVFRDNSTNARNGQETGAPSAKDGNPEKPFKVRPSDFCEIDRGFGEGPCDCCGSEWVHFQERMTRERMSAPVRMNRKICRSCYEKAKRDEAASFRSLPQVIDPVSLVKVTCDLGRCQVCDTFKATWHDPETHTAICDSCRSRILREGS